MCDSQSWCPHNRRSAADVHYKPQRQTFKPQTDTHRLLLELCQDQGTYHSLLSTNISEAATEEALVEALHDVQTWSIIMSRFLGILDIMSIRKPVHDKYESYIALAYGLKPYELLEGIMG
jgi:hypothetical protein